MARHHSDEQKARIVAHFHAHLKAGKSAQVAAKKMGVSYVTLRRWINAGIKSSKAKSKKPSMAKSKALQPAPAAARITLTLPNGYQVEADDPNDIVQVLQALSK
jgi:transposase